MKSGYYGQQMKTSIPLKMSCPHQCKCGDNKSYYWTHPQCDNARLFIDDEGYVFCEKYKNDNSQCYKQFVQDFIFVCGENQNQLQSCSDFMMLLAQGMRQMELKISDSEQREFIMKLSCQVPNKWQYQD